MLANNNVVNCPCFVNLSAVSSKMLLELILQRSKLEFFHLFFLRSYFFDNFPVFSARETAFFVTAARN